jgi:hypothetical protein
LTALAAQWIRPRVYCPTATTAALIVFFCDFFVATFTGTAFFTAVFLATLGAAFTAAAFFAAHRFFNAATIAALPAALSLRSGFDGSGVTGAVEDAAHRLRWASLMRFRAAALIGRRFAVGASGVATG